MLNSVTANRTVENDDKRNRWKPKAPGTADAGPSQASGLTHPPEVPTMAAARPTPRDQDGPDGTSDRTEVNLLETEKNTQISP